MIEAPCAACGTMNRLAESELPVGAKFVTCSSCKSRVALPATTAKPAIPTPKPRANTPPAIPKTPPPTPKPSANADLADLPAPKRTSALAGAGEAKPAPKSPFASLDADLPAPKPSGKPAPSALDLDDIMPADLPAPKPAKPPVPAKPPAKPAPAGIVDLPAPKAAPTGIVDLPAPKGGPAGIVDLPAPKGGPAGIVDLPMPKAGAPGSVDLPAPKGFFDDLPVPAKPGGGGIDLPAPKGFFDDLPQPAAAKPAGGATDLPAPKGFFDDLPQPAAKAKPLDLPLAPPKAPAGKAPAPAPIVNNVFDDLGAGPPAAAGLPLDIDLSAPSGLELDLGPASAPDAVPMPAAAPFGDLDLSEPSAKPVISIKTPSKDKIEPKPVNPAAAAKSATAGKLDLKLEIESDAPGAPAAVATKDRAKKKAAAELSAEEKAARQKRTRIVLGAALGVAALGGGGFFMYQRHVKAQERADKIDASLAAARTALVGAAPTHWQIASNAANDVLQIDASNGAANGVAAEAAAGAALDLGINATAKIAAARRMINDAIADGHAGPELARAQALVSIAANQPDAAIKKLQPLAQAAPEDAFLQLYLGWAELAKGDGKAAADAFAAAIAANPAVKVPAQYGHGRAELLLADYAAAKTDFAAVLEATKNEHIGAQVGLAQTLPPSQTSQKEQDLEAIFGLKADTLKNADPRALVLAHSLSADIARQSGRLDVARDRYHKALAIDATAVVALVGLAEVELRDGKLDVAAELINKAVSQAKDDPTVRLELGELEVRQGKLADAGKILQDLEGRTPPLPPLLHAQLEVVKGKMLEAQGADDDAVAAYEQGAKDAGDLDLTPTMAAVEKLTQLSNKAGDPAKADAYRQRANGLLSSLATRAQDDPQLAATLGVAYLQAGDAAKAESFLHKSVEMRGSDVDARIQLAKALAKLGQADEAIDQLKQAQKQDASRADIALELARTYEDTGRDDDAKQAYNALLASKDVTIPMRVRAGRYFARKGDIAKAAAQAEPILAAEPENPGGHYLKGEGLLAQGGVAKLDDARKEISLAVDGDPDPQYLDAQGRVAEAIAATGETKYYELAKTAYQRAVAGDPKIFNSQAGLGRVYVWNKDWEVAVKPLEAANKLNPSDPDVMFNLGLSAYKLGNKKAAVQYFVASAKIKPTAETYHQLALVYFDLNQIKDTINTLLNATRLGAELEAKGKAPDWLTDDYGQLGELAFQNNLYSIAKPAWQRFVERHPKPGALLDEATNALATTLRSN